MAKIEPEIRKKIKKYISEISGVCRVDKVVLFGSYAKGTPKKDSDIDLAIFSREINDANRREFISLFLKHILKYKLDIQPLAFNIKDYESNSNDFISEIKRTGILLFQK